LADSATFSGREVCLKAGLVATPHYSDLAADTASNYFNIMLSVAVFLRLRST